jgi:hypothetical protein
MKAKRWLHQNSQHNQSDQRFKVTGQIRRVLQLLHAPSVRVRFDVLMYKTAFKQEMLAFHT